jgi:hypothetical protein
VVVRLWIWLAHQPHLVMPGLDPGIQSTCSPDERSDIRGMDVTLAPDFAALIRATMLCARCAGHPRLDLSAERKDVDARDKPGHGECPSSVIASQRVARMRAR